jgi:hypothetical protein
MPDPPVDISKLSGKIAGALRKAHNPLRNAKFSDAAARPLINDMDILISALRESLYAGEWQGAQETVILNGLKNLEEFSLNANLLTTISEDIGNRPSTQALGTLRRQWNECTKTLLNKLAPVASSLDQVSVLTSAAVPGEAAPARDDRRGGGEAQQAG